MSGWTNRGKYNALAGLFRGATLPTNYYAMLVTTTPDADDNLASDQTEIALGNGYTQGGISLTPNATDFDVLAEDDVNDRATLQIKDLVWTASGGPIPSSGLGALYMCLTNDIDTAASGNREIINFYSLGSARTVSDGQTLTIQNAEMRFTE
jgi:hypothetical protein